MTQPALTLHQIGKQYPNGTIALDNLNLTIAKSQFMSLVGPSGCGKSTVLRVIAGLTKRTIGQVEWQEPSLQQHLAFVFQDAALMPWATVWDNVRLPLKLMGLPRQKAAEAIAQVLKMVDLQGFEHAYPRELSGGMQMRVSIARALITQPSLLLMDEPFGALDDMTRSRLNTDLLSLWEQQQWTVLFVTHNIYEAVYLSQRVVVMAARPGRVVAEVAIEAPYPRTEAFRTSMQYTDYCRQVAAHLAATIPAVSEL